MTGLRTADGEKGLLNCTTAGVFAEFVAYITDQDSQK